MKIEVYTDGGCTYNGQVDAKASYGYYFPNHKELSFAARVPDEQSQTNNRGELLAILEAVKKTQASFPASEVNLSIYTDSEYAKNCLTKWLPGWVARGWKTATGSVVINRDLIEDITNIIVCFDSYTIIHVRAHTGGDDEFSRNNHIVDRMVANVIRPEQAKVIQPLAQVKGPLQLMGPPISETHLYNWCMSNLNELDSEAMRIAIITAYTKTMKKNGYDVVRHRLHRSVEYRLTSGNHLTAVHK